MKSIVIALLLISQYAYGQADSYESELIKLAQVYKSYHVMKPTDSTYQQLDSIQVSDLLGAKAFITELIKENNNIADKKFVTKPDSSTLQNLYLIRGLTWNMFDHQFGGAERREFGLDSLLAESIDHKEQFANYYNMMYTSILNKNSPLDMSSVNFDLDDYGFTDAEKTIFFLESMETLGTMISGYFYVDPPNFDKAISKINNFPTFDNQPYYKYTTFEFEDFDFTYSSKHPKVSYKEFQLNKLMNTIICHSMSLSQNTEGYGAMQDIFENSILINREYWKYCEAPEVLEQIYGK